MHFPVGHMWPDVAPALLGEVAGEHWSAYHLDASDDGGGLLTVVIPGRVLQGPGRREQLGTGSAGDWAAELGAATPPAGAGLKPHAAPDPHVYPGCDF